jgi:hypothetical protein
MDASLGVLYIIFVFIFFKYVINNFSSFALFIVYYFFVFFQYMVYNFFTSTLMDLYDFIVLCFICMCHLCGLMYKKYNGHPARKRNIKHCSGRYTQNVILSLRTE